MTETTPQFKQKYLFTLRPADEWGREEDRNYFFGTLDRISQRESLYGNKRKMQGGSTLRHIRESGCPWWADHFLFIELESPSQKELDVACQKVENLWIESPTLQESSTLYVHDSSKENYCDIPRVKTIKEMMRARRIVRWNHFIHAACSC